MAHPFHPSTLVAQAVDLPDLARALEVLLSGGYSVWTDGSLLETRQLVAKVNGLRIVVNPREHPPPHFHIHGGGLNVSFALADCGLLSGSADAATLRLVKWWYTESRQKLISAWNASRPSDCAVGPFYG